MSIAAIKNALPDYARDLKLNLSSVLSPSGAPGLEERMIFATAVAAALAARHRGLAQALEAEAGERLDQDHRRALRAAVAVMSMNNVYYRFLHLVGDREYQRLPARLRMNAIGSPGIAKDDFELLSLAVSAVNGCGMCVESHEQVLRKAEVERETIQSAVRIASVVHAVAVVLENESADIPAERAEAA